MVTIIDFKLADIKLERYEDYFLKLGKNLEQDFEVIYTFHKNAFLRATICQYL